MLPIDSFRFQFITHSTERFDVFTSAKIALEGGCRWIQLRMKDAALEEIEQVAMQLKPLCKSYNAVFLLNDHVELCRKVAAAGVHLGKTDMPVEEARRILGDNFIIGATANTFNDIQRAVTATADYVGLGPFRFTTTKNNLSPILGINGYTEIVEQCKNHNITTPIVAIGGITNSDIVPILQTGINGIALSAAILQADEPVEETKRICYCLNHDTFPLPPSKGEGKIKGLKDDHD